MHHPRLIKKQHTALIFLILLPLAAFCKTGTIAYIRADIANIRQEPTSTASITGRIRINEKLNVQKEESGWLFVEYFGDASIGYSPDSAIVAGWVSNTLVSPKPISIKELKDSVGAAATPLLKKRWADRLVVAFPDDPANWKILLKVATELGDTAGVKRAQMHLSGREDIYVAQCRYGQIKLLGKLDSTGAFTSYVWDNVSSIDTTGTGNRYHPMQSQGLDKQLITTLATCNWGKYGASFASGTIGSAQSLGSEIIWVSFGYCPKDTILTTQVHEQGKRKGSGKNMVDLFSIRQKINNNQAAQKLEDSAYAFCRQNTKESDKSNGNISSVQPLNAFHTLQIFPYPAMNIFEAIAKVAVPGWRDSGPNFQDAVGLFDEFGSKIYPHGVAQPFPVDNSWESNANNLCFFTFPKRGDGRVYTVYRYADVDGSGANYCSDLLCFQEGKKLMSFSIERYWDGD